MSDLQVRLVLQAIDRATAPLRQVTAAMGGLSSATSKLNVVGQRLVGLGGDFARFGAVAGGVSVAMGAAFGRSVIDVAAEFESFNTQLTALEGSGDKAKQVMKDLQIFAKQTTLTLPETVQAYAQLKAFGLDPLAGTLQALADTAAKQGKGFEQVKGIALALGQAWTKTKLQGDDILQMVERGVPVWDLLSKATGRTAVELQEMSSKGLLGRRTIALLIEEMGKASKGASAEFAKTWDGQLSTLSDSWTNFRLQVSEGGGFSLLKGELSGLNDTIDRMEKSGEMQHLADIVGGEMATGVKVATEAFHDLVGEAGGIEGFAKQVGEALASVGAAFGAFTEAVSAAGRAVKWLQSNGMFADTSKAEFWKIDWPQFDIREGGLIDRAGKLFGGKGKGAAGAPPAPDAAPARAPSAVVPSIPAPLPGPAPLAASAPLASAPAARQAPLATGPAPSAATIAGQARAQAQPARAEVSGRVELTIKSDAPVRVDRLEARNIDLDVTKRGLTMPDVR